MSDYANSIQQVSSHRIVYALCELNKDGKLKARYWVMCLSMGSHPTYGVFSVSNGKMIEIWGSKSQIKERHPHLAWRIKQSTWSLSEVGEKLTPEEKAEYLAKQLSKKSDNVVEFVSAPSEIVAGRIPKIVTDELVKRTDKPVSRAKTRLKTK